MNKSLDKKAWNDRPLETLGEGFAKFFYAFYLIGLGVVAVLWNLSKSIYEHLFK